MLRLAALFMILMLGGTSFSPGAAEPAGMRMEVFKSKRELHFFEGDQLIKKYRVGLGGQPKQPKEREGDQKTPEGKYFICVKNPQSRYYLSLGISYPGPQDAQRGFKAGLITQSQHDSILEAHRQGITPPWNTRLGGEIFIHGHGSQKDWTLGCIALDDADMNELFQRVTVRTPITIHP